MEPTRNYLSDVSIPQLLVWGLLLAGTCTLAYLFTRINFVAGLGFAMLPAGLCLLYVALRNPVHALFGMLIVNYFVMGLGRYVHGVPAGVLLDAVIGLNILVLLLHAFTTRIPWRNTRSGITIVALIWVIYCSLEILNPNAISVQGWVSSVRTLAFHFLIIVILTQLVLCRFKYLRQMLLVWSVLTLIAVAKALIQKYIGFDAAEKYWLFVEGGASTHIIYTGIRYFSFYSDAANFGAGMGLSMVVFSLTALNTHDSWKKLYLLLVAAAAGYGMLISGTRSAMAIPFVGYTVYILLSRQMKIMIAGFVAILMAFCFLNFTSIGQGNSLIRRARSAFNTQDASLQVRFDNQAKMRAIMADKPFGAGIGHGGGKAKVFAPDAPLSQIPTDSWFVMVWVETGVVGVALHILILLYVLGYGSFLVFFRLRHPMVRGITAAFVSGISGVVIMSYANEVLGQIPTGVITYMCMGFISLAPLFDRELTGTLEPTEGVPQKRLS